MQSAPGPDNPHYAAECNRLFGTEYRFTSKHVTCFLMIAFKLAVLNLVYHIPCRCTYLSAVAAEGLLMCYYAKSEWRRDRDAKDVDGEVCMGPVGSRCSPPHPTKALSTLSQKSAPVAVVSPFSATVSLLCDSLTFLRQCGQGLRVWGAMPLGFRAEPRPKMDFMHVWPFGIRKKPSAGLAHILSHRVSNV